MTLDRTSNPSAETPRPSASLLIAAPWQRPSDTSSSSSSNNNEDAMDYRLLMMKRSARGVFSSGTVDEADRQDNWSSLFATTAANCADLAYRICALRETFEESGILFTEPSAIIDRFSSDQLADWRKQVYANPRRFFELCEQHKLRPAIDRLVYFQRWITPAAEKRRFDTRFYFIALTERESRALGALTSSSYAASAMTMPQFHDGGETVASVWYTPRESLAAYQHKHIDVMPPQWCLLDDLSRMARLADAVAQLGAQPVATYMPEFHRASEQHIYAVLPDDWRHTTSNADKTARPVHQLDFQVEGKIARIQRRIRSATNASSLDHPSKL
ncbi:hypothetical protein SYNPS1DRAFT_30043 [Syncephalis pseudoplumigaleata]|uniref:Nudix hydrolase domain-containing protein n=1 Tax=Syncephalis pseudoplumigaleata TaxID=1712513 RepID=A0A4P9YXD9_9FUNG|nr:hypothetical protein SYNPS1DRAFT_30043 [Syncephalis pseudoplumigaleata]|eukprot:RKP24192.1 hypothetical protein SYNPS1DRAFT_30043 [Syncephalis pseudoplumigaleata]